MSRHPSLLDVALSDPEMRVYETLVRGWGGQAAVDEFRRLVIALVHQLDAPPPEAPDEP